MAASITALQGILARTRTRTRVDRAPAPLVPSAPGLGGALPSRIHLWRGSSGRQHLASVYTLFDCPPLPPSIALLVSRDAEGRRVVKAVLRLENEAASLNLARVRQDGANLRANEVHVSFIAGNEEARMKLALDISLGNLDRPG